MEKRRVFQPLTRILLGRAVPYRSKATDVIIGFFLFCKMDHFRIYDFVLARILRDASIVDAPQDERRTESNFLKQLIMCSLDPAHPALRPAHPEEQLSAASRRVLSGAQDNRDIKSVSKDMSGKKNVSSNLNFLKNFDKYWPASPFVRPFIFVAA